ncbi:MAG: iron complex outerrane recepter protein, partial [Candidatus Eremiobacteraeota bacterium]|nr:iron complex outerrane recepter protein [Candidatus Eremiobacteraeota bacterium]
PIIYGGGGADEYFQYDIGIDRVESVEGGTSGILAVNGAGATINFISRPLNFDQAGGVARLTGATYGDQRADLWYSAPLPMLGKDVAFSVGGYIDSTKGERSSPFTYQTYHFKAQLEKKFDDGGFLRATYKRWDEHDPYYADMPYAVNNGSISGVPGLSTQTGNVMGSGFANIAVPDSCFTGNCLRNFGGSQGIHGKGNEYRLDFQKPITDSFSVFARGRYLDSDWDFNGLFPGSGSGNAGLASAVDYLTYSANPMTAVSPINSLLGQGVAAFPTATQFGIKNLTTGQIIAASNTAALNALNGNGLLQQTVLNHQTMTTRDFGSDFGAKWDASGDGWKNSLTVGGMYYRVTQSNDQSGVATVINDVTNGSSIYDIVALNSSGGVVGTLSNNGLISYGDWGNGMWHDTLSSISVYFNDELTIGDRLHIDFGMRHEHMKNEIFNGNTLAVNPPVPAGVGGVVQTVANSFDGTYTQTDVSYDPTSYTIGANYTLNSNLSVYARYEYGNQTGGGNNTAPVQYVTLYEAGLRYSGYGFLGSVTGFRTEFDNFSSGFTDPTNPAIAGGITANIRTNGVNVEADYTPAWAPLHAFHLNVIGTYQDATMSNLVFNGTPQPQYDGLVPGRTPKVLYAITPSWDFPNGKGQIYARYKYVGKIFADSGDGVALPSYGVVSIGGNYDITPRLNLNVSVDNVTNELGLTEGNPRQGLTQQVVAGYFYGRGIAGTNAIAQLTLKF